VSACKDHLKAAVAYAVDQGGLAGLLDKLAYLRGYGVGPDAPGRGARLFLAKDLADYSFTFAVHWRDEASVARAVDYLPLQAQQVALDNGAGWEVALQGGLTCAAGADGVPTWSVNT
jgi:hypothetical protein